MKLGFGVAALTFGALTALGVAVAKAETRALVVGVSGYPALAESIRLTGPKNDSREFANMIVRLGVPANNVTVLADGVSGLADGIAAPAVGTKAAIIAGLDRLASTSKAGDLVVFYFSGHGTQQPDLDGDEQGGADEVFLPYDVGKWGKDGIENALRDDELRERVDKILATGADFFGVIDACHSATGFRALPGDDARSRDVEPAVLGVPALSSSPKRELLPRRPADLGKRGRAAFFYAAQESEEALEKVPPNGEEGQNFGVFTYNLVRRMSQTPNLTYRTLHQAVMSDIKRNTLMTTQTPEIEGELIDEPVLQRAGASDRRQWPIFNGKLQGGELSGIRAGSIVALYDDAAAEDDRPIAHGIVEQSGATRATVASIAYPCAEAACAPAADPAPFKKARFARIVEPGVDFAITLSEPIRLDPADGFDYAPAIAAMRAVIDSPALSARVAMRQSGYEIAVGLTEGKLAFAAAAGAIDQDGPGSSPRLTLPQEPAKARATIAEAVGRIARVLALQRLGDGAAASTALNARLHVSKATSAAKDGRCSDIETDYAHGVPVPSAGIFSDCDIVSIEMANAGKKPLDVTVLLVGADFSITPVWPQDGASSRILAAESKLADILQMSPNPTQTSIEERLILVAVPGVGRANVVFDNLEQEGLRAAPDDPPEVAAVRALVATGLTDLSRSTATTKAIEEELAIQVLPFRVVSRTP